MISAAEATFRLSRPIGKDGTVRELLVDREKATGIRHPLLDQAIVPRQLDYLWRAFLVLHRGRAVAVDGIRPLSVREIAAYADLYGFRWTPWEIDTLLALDQRIVDLLNEVKRDGDNL